jgi:hypothetical protein
MQEYIGDIVDICNKNLEIFPGMQEEDLQAPVSAVLKDLWKRLAKTLRRNPVLAQKYNLYLESRHAFYDKRNNLDVGRAVTYLRTLCQQIKNALRTEYLTYIKSRAQATSTPIDMTKEPASMLEYAMRRSDLKQLLKQGLWQVVDAYLQHRVNVAKYTLAVGKSWDYERGDLRLETELRTSLEKKKITTADEKTYVEGL